MDHPVVLTLLIFAIIAFMYVAGEVLKPLALAILLSFALVPISRQFERFKMPRVLAVVLTILLVMGGLGAVCYKVGQQLDSLATSCPSTSRTSRTRSRGCSLASPMPSPRSRTSPRT